VGSILLRGLGLAQSDPFNNMGRSFRGDEAHLQTSEALITLVFLACLILLVWLLSRVRGRRERELRTNSPRGLFRELCQAHRLERRARWLLARLARHYRLQDPGALFLNPRIWHAAEDDAAFAEERQELAELRDRLFGSLAQRSNEVPASAAARR
jgi:hypothetical protein